MDGVQLPLRLSHFEEAVYFLPLSSVSRICYVVLGVILIAILSFAIIIVKVSL